MQRPICRQLPIKREAEWSRSGQGADSMCHVRSTSTDAFTQPPFFTPKQRSSCRPSAQYAPPTPNFQHEVPISTTTANFRPHASTSHAPRVLLSHEGRPLEEERQRLLEMRSRAFDDVTTSAADYRRPPPDGARSGRQGIILPPVRPSPIGGLAGWDTFQSTTMASFIAHPTPNFSRRVGPAAAQTFNIDPSRAVTAAAPRRETRRRRLTSR